MLKHRIIPCVLLKDWQLTKSVKFKEFRTIGHPKVTSKIYNRRNVDELIVLDIDASGSDNSINYKTLSDIAKECFMPLTLGGGIKSLQDINSLLAIGADKVSINTIAIKNPDFIREASKKFGSQCIVVSIDVIEDSGMWKVYNKNLGILEEPELLEWAKRCEELGAGEILLTSVDRDGCESGYDTKLISLLAKELTIPIIANGGASTPEDAVQAVKSGADAVAAASIFHFTQYTPNNIKEALQEAGFAVRL
ncbi:imidazole glycerol phosphate synthase subunit HisF [bacterium]|nr:imidazole glycerol phosphate synthase subunit HisF [bacterium]MBU1990609.1 imidazole glycerol phosphate synthase subunit HisF [bacterium]